MSREIAHGLDQELVFRIITFRRRFVQILAARLNRQLFFQQCISSADPPKIEGLIGTRKLNAIGIPLHAIPKTNRETRWRWAGFRTSNIIINIIEACNGKREFCEWLHALAQLIRKQGFGNKIITRYDGDTGSRK